MKMTIDEIKHHAHQFMCQLCSGGSVPSIVKYLELSGIRGDRGKQCTCVITRYFKKRLESITRDPLICLSVDYNRKRTPRTGQLTIHDRYNCRGEVNFPEILITFVGKFDEGKYPQLEGTPNEQATV